MKVRILRLKNINIVTTSSNPIFLAVIKELSFYNKGLEKISALESVAKIILWNQLVWWPDLTNMGFNHVIIKQRTHVLEDNYTSFPDFQGKVYWLHNQSRLPSQEGNLKALKCYCDFPSHFSSFSVCPPSSARKSPNLPSNFFSQIAGCFPRLLTSYEMVN